MWICGVGGFGWSPMTPRSGQEWADRAFYGIELLEKLPNCDFWCLYSCPTTLVRTRQFRWKTVFRLGILLFSTNHRIALIWLRTIFTHIVACSTSWLENCLKMPRRWKLALINNLLQNAVIFNFSTWVTLRKVYESSGLYTMDKHFPIFIQFVFLTWLLFCLMLSGPT